jgi:hypothetical protein
VKHEMIEARLRAWSNSLDDLMRVLGLQRIISILS